MTLWMLILNHVLFTVAIASFTHSTPGELVFVAQSLGVHDPVLGEFLPRKTPLYNLYCRFHRCGDSYMLQWNWKLSFPHGM